MLSGNEFRALAKAQSTDPTRFNLRDSFVVDGVVYACDGHRVHAIESSDPDEVLCEAPAFDAAAAAKGSKPKQTFRISEVPSEEQPDDDCRERIRLENCETVMLQTPEIPERNMNRPEVRVVLPKPEDVGFEVHFNAQYLKEACEAALLVMGKAGHKSITLRFKRDPEAESGLGALSPVGFEGNENPDTGHKATGAIMPMRR